MRSSAHSLPLATRDALARAALDLAGEQSWSALTVSAVLARADIAQNDLAGARITKTILVDIIADYLDRRAIADVDVDPDATARERVFDAVMARFDAMEEHRAGVLALADAAARDPRLAAQGWRATLRSARALLDHAGEAGRGPQAALRARGLAVIALRVGHTAWRGETSPDLSRTMAQLDSALRDVDDTLSRWPLSQLTKLAMFDPISAVTKTGEKVRKTAKKMGANACRCPQKGEPKHPRTTAEAPSSQTPPPPNASDADANAPLSPAADMDA